MYRVFANIFIHRLDLIAFFINRNDVEDSEVRLKMYQCQQSMIMLFMIWETLLALYYKLRLYVI